MSFTKFSKSLVLVAVAALAIGGGVAFADHLEGQLDQVNCISEDSTGGLCLDGRALDRPMGAAFSSDEGRVAVAANNSDAIAILRRQRDLDGRLVQDDNTGGCVSETGADNCFDGRALDGARDVAAPNDANNLYGVAETSESVVTLYRDIDDGRYKMSGQQAACVSNDGTGGQCVDGRGLDLPASITVAKNNFAYVGGENTIAVFRRSTARSSGGVLTQLDGTAGCVNDDGSDGCADGNIPGRVVDLYVTNDGKHLYAAVSFTGAGAVLVFSRNSSTGALTPVQCISDLGIPAGCTNATSPMIDPHGIAGDKGGKNVYVAANGSDSLVIFTRNKNTGALTDVGCHSDTGTLGCADARNLNEPERVAIATNTKSMSVTAENGLANFSRNKNTGALTQWPGIAGCNNEDGSDGCTDGHALENTFDVLYSGALKAVYVTAEESDSAVAFKRN